MISSKYLCLDGFEAACKNQIEIDLKFLESVGLDPQKNYLAPRPNVWIQFINKPERIKFVFLFCAIIWLYTGSYLYIFISFFSLLLKHLRLNNNKINYVFDSKDSTFIAFCNKSLSIASAKGIGFHVNTIIDFTGDNKPPKNLSSKVINYLSLVKLYDLFKLFLISIRINYFFQKNNNITNGLQSYTLVNWLLAKEVLDKIQGNFIISEHYDRWAVLADLCISSRNNSKNESNYLTLVQHGTVSSLQNGEHVFSLNLFYKLQYVKYLYVYDLQALSFFEKNVIFPSSRSKIKCCLFSPVIELLDIDATLPSILIVGHPFCLQFHSHLFSKLEFLNINVFYKPHPATKSAIPIDKKGWQYISNKNSFPRVNLITSYPSTLVAEYQQHNIESYVHPLYLKNNNFDFHCEEIINKLKIIRDDFL